MPDLTSTLPAGTSQRRSASQAVGLVALPWLFAVALVVTGPWILDAYTANILIRAFFVATVALTVDVLWGHSGYLTFGSDQEANKPFERNFFVYRMDFQPRRN